MVTQFICKNDGRREAVRSNPTWNGIDYLEVTSYDQKTLKIYFLHNLPSQSNPVPPSPAPELKEENICIEGGVRIKNIEVESVSSNKNTLTVIVNEAGDFSNYKLCIINFSTEIIPPTGFDSQLSSVDFSFKAGCPNEFDCKTKTVFPTEKIIEPKIDYLAKDYTSFRRLMLDHLSLIMPDWKERNPADLQTTLVELLAYIGDHLSYYQDAVATEAYLRTARKRISVRRHSRLLDYFMHDGCNARTWVHLAVNDYITLPEKTMLLTRGPDDKALIANKDLNKILNEQQPLVFETKHNITLCKSHNEISFYTWSDSECCLPRGSTRATLKNAGENLSLEKHDILIFEEKFSPATGLEADADPTHRHAVRLINVLVYIDKVTGDPVLEIEWDEEDALPFPLCLTAIVNNADGTTKVEDISVARGNIVLADHGITLEGQVLIPDTAPLNGNYKPQLQHIGITTAVLYEHELAKHLPATGMLVQDPHEATAEIILQEEETWEANCDLLGSDRFAAEFVVEVEQDGIVQLRFGDDIMGKKPSGGFKPLATYRIGNGRKGNVGSKAIGRVVWDSAGITDVRNPLPAKGGMDTETMAEAREFASQAFRIQKRAVTEADYTEKTELHNEVQKAAARFHWTGSWYTVFVTVNRKDGQDVDTEFKRKIYRHLEQYRMAGYDLEIREPRFVSLDIIMNVCVKPGYFKNNVKENLLDVFSRYDLPNGISGFFHPDNFTFGQYVYLSAIYKKAMEIAGVESVEVKKFQQWAKKPNNEMENGFLQPAELEIIRLDNDHNYPENGKIDFVMFGGI